ncbi:hypothetical protein LTR17_003879 [Elasticomyces elasticus]|nr:hypothetical protein LTR17_003879 [Elasticomyces elasticus]
MRLLEALRNIGRMQKAPQESLYLRLASTASTFRILDLPAELRMQIFQRIADSIQGEYNENERTRLIDNEGTRISAEQEQQLKLALCRRQTRFLETQLMVVRKAQSRGYRMPSGSLLEIFSLISSGDSA